VLVLAILLTNLNCFTFSTHSPASTQSKKFILEVDYAPKSHTALKDNRFAIILNERLIAEITPNDNNQDRLALTVKLKLGENIINFLNIA
jgi:hypothetical protein